MREGRFHKYYNNFNSEIDQLTYITHSSKSQANCDYKITQFPYMHVKYERDLMENCYNNWLFTHCIICIPTSSHNYNNRDIFYFVRFVLHVDIVFPITKS